MNKHTCRTTPGECRGCESQAAEWLARDWDEGVRSDMADVLASKRYGSLSTLSGEDLETVLGTTDRDPATAYATATDAARVALRSVLALEDGEGVATDVLRTLRRGGAVPSMVRQDMKGLRASVRAAYTVAAREAGEALPPWRPSGERWMPRAAASPVTYAGPVAHGTGSVAAWIVTPDGTTTRGVTAPPETTVYAERVRYGKGDDGEQTTTRERIPLPWMTPTMATEPAAMWAYGTGYRPDRGSVAADRFALRRRPTMGETADPLPAVVKPSTRKRKRDGSMGGPAVITHR